MRYEVSVGLIIGAALSIKCGKISNNQLITIKESIRDNAPEYYVDFSRDSVYSEIEANGDCFALENGDFVLNEFYMEHIGRVKRCFYDVLEEDIRKALDMALVIGEYNVKIREGQNL